MTARIDRLKQLRGRWRELPAPHRRWIVVNAVVVTAIVNFAANGAIAWLSVAGKSRVPLWSSPGLGRASTITDTVGTLFFLPLFTCLLVTTAVRVELRAGRLAPFRFASPWWPDRLPAGRLRRGAVMGGIALVLLSPLAVIALVVADSGGLSVGQFVLYKAVLGVVFGAFVTPVIALRAMGDVPGRHS